MLFLIYYKSDFLKMLITTGLKKYLGNVAMLFT